jgi:hypothetical protein
MSQISIEWVLEQRVLFVRVEGHIIGEELIRLDDDVLTHMDQAGATGPVHFVEDVRGMTNAPPLLVSLNLKLIRDPRLGWSISIGAVQNPWIRLVYQSLVVATGIHWRDASSLEQALEYLNRIDPTLPDLTGWISKEQPPMPQSRPQDA